jgi:hypothetical protein
MTSVSTQVDTAYQRGVTSRLTSPVAADTVIDTDVNVEI